ncbi:hypothetical protein GWK08_06620 [Leptobacterium flavescens]|uniref:Uncharacterized protein n=1 Tax=Leptobacterium flavescens TaxID=472055 RepID=A0A6P0UII0_9FLAO|nr:hypothetical protein [Leptobacterium flavescens]NER13105.1 hypothetical protein [Leptobacterium flavescens]
MKLKLFQLLLVLLVLSYSCTNESNVEEDLLTSPPGNIEGVVTPNLPGPSSGGIGVIGVIFEDVACFNSQGILGYRYKLHAAAIEGTKPYDRIVHISVIKTTNGISSEIEGKSLLIPANAHSSEAVYVFTNIHTYAIGAVQVWVDSIVRADGAPDATVYTTYNGNYTINNCFETNTGGGGSPCGSGVGESGGPGETGSNDADGDGICSGIDPNDNDPCIPGPSPACNS